MQPLVRTQPLEGFKVCTARLKVKNHVQVAAPLCKARKVSLLVVAVEVVEVGLKFLFLQERQPGLLKSLAVEAVDAEDVRQLYAAAQPEVDVVAQDAVLAYRHDIARRTVIAGRDAVVCNQCALHRAEDVPAGGIKLL